VNNDEKGQVSGTSGRLRKTNFGPSTPKPPNTAQEMSTDLHQAGGGCEQKPETEFKEGAGPTSLVPYQFSRGTGMLVGANSAATKCGEWTEDGWQELLARLSTGCKI
jgi:hypothetical protein